MGCITEHPSQRGGASRDAQRYLETVSLQKMAGVLEKDRRKCGNAGTGRFDSGAHGASFLKNVSWLLTSESVSWRENLGGGTEDEMGFGRLVGGTTVTQETK